MQSNAFHSLRWLLTSAKSQRHYLLWAGIFTLVKVLVGLAIVVSLHALIDTMLHVQIDRDRIMYWAAIFMALIFSRYLCLCMAAWLSHKAAFALIGSLKISLAEKLLHLPVSFFSKYRSTDIRQIMEDDVNRIEAFMAHHITDLTTALTTPILASILLFYIHWPLALIALLPLPIALSAQIIMFKNYANKSAEYQQVLVDMNQRSTELVSNIACLRLLQGAKLGVGRLRESVEHYVKVVDEWTRQASWAYAFLKVALDFSFLLLLPAAFYFYVAGSLTMAEFIVVMILGLTLMQPFYSLLMFSGLLNQILDGVKRIQTVENEPTLHYGDRSWPAEVTLRCHHVSYRFQTPGNEVLSDINLHIHCGEKIAIIGESGSGKSTLLQLLAGFYAPQTGVVEYGGHPLFHHKRDQIYRHIAYVMQDNHIFQGSIKDNIVMGNGNISEDKIWEMLCLAKANTFVAQKPEQLNFVLTGQYNRLSGGERQRLGIARALLKPAQLYFFDEATRFFDARTEAQVLGNIMAYLSKKTVVFVTHRIENLRFADRILVLNQGRVMGFDTHAKLLNNCETYQQLQSVSAASASTKSSSARRKATHYA